MVEFKYGVFMKKVTARLLVFFIGVPLIVCLAVIKFCHHLPLHITVLVATVIAAIEMYTLLQQKLQTQPKVFVVILP